MITARMLLDRMTPSTIVAMLYDIDQAEDDPDTDAIWQALIDQLVVLIGEDDAAAELEAAGLEER